MDLENSSQKTGNEALEMKRAQGQVWLRCRLVPKVEYSGKP